MKRICKLSVLLAFVTLLLTSCHQEKPVGTPHRARYEVISVDNTPTKVKLSYVTQTGIGQGQGLESILLDIVTPWQHEFTSYGNFQFLLIGITNEAYNGEKKHFVERIYLDDQLITEQQSNEHYGVYLTYSYQE